MRLVNSKYNIKIELLENQVIALVVEKAVAFREMVQDFFTQVQGQEGDFILSEGDEECAINKCASILIDPLALDLNDKKILNKMYGQLMEAAVDLFEEKEVINSHIVELIEKITERSQYEELSYNLELDWTQLFKLYNIRILDEEVDILPKLIEYEKILVHILHQKVLCLVNIKAYLDEKELRDLYQSAEYLKLHLILIESRENISIEKEKILIIDKDQCTIIK